jgi:hypothetical protein
MTNKKQITNPIEIENFVKEFQEKVRVKLNAYDTVLSTIIEEELENTLNTKSMMEIKSSVFAYYLILGILLEKMKATAIDTGIPEELLNEKIEEIKNSNSDTTSSYVSIKNRKITEEDSVPEGNFKVEDEMDGLYEDVALLNLTSSKKDRN